MKIDFIGAVRTVTGSMHLISNGEYRFLIDCGLFQGHRKDFYRINSQFPFDPAGIDACILSHAHIDHSGNIPNLIKNGFDSRILTTDATRDLCQSMLPDSGHIQEEDIKYLNKKKKKKGEPLQEPLYTRKDAENSLQFFSGHPYEQQISIGGGNSVTFYDAGHVLGSSTPLLEIDGGGEKVRIGYAVDLGRENIPILNDPVTPPDIDYLFLESTYGGRVHAPPSETHDTLAEIVNRTVERKGKIIIPSFALERTQEIVYYLNDLFNDKRIPKIPVIVDSPLAVNLTEVFFHHPECYDEEMYQAFKNGDDPLGARHVKYIKDVEESKALHRDPDPKIIISASGMCEAGRILHHLKNNIEDERNTVLIVGYMAENTLGRRIAEKYEKVRIFGQEYQLNAEVEIMNSFSAHADRNELYEYVKPLKDTLKGIFIVHGEESQSEALYRLLKDKGFPVHFPNPGDSMEI
ncbi:MAG: MBL fold metallo-hydrolase [Candidatus Latescibacteria bacterium]|nr:MBL fold metallo-hydrolase [bacterium]MBD3423958.1 MBL fold metallo-hydrolase [Candidatus Latescibacterota bacterium]